ncbi:MAG: proline--tRNA ligase, partial [Candidatus Cloacimonetes bacterium]|nr:proline--tRNA ligase [Candidatus Cloacimonadota bacterium]
PVLKVAKEIQNSSKKTMLEDMPVYPDLDDRDLTSGERNWYCIKKGIPLRIEIGPRDVASQSVMLARRDKEPRDKVSVPLTELKEQALAMLKDMQAGIYARALAFRNENTIKIDDNKEFYKYFTPKNAEQPEIHGGFALSHWCGGMECEERIKDDLKVTVRCIPFDQPEEDGVCISCGKPSQRRVIFAKSY